MPGREIARVEDEAEDFYGRRYWFEYQEQELGTPDITIRARGDLPERCVYWLRTVLRYRLPPGRVLDVGCGHGGFVMLLRRAGFEASGLELSPWVVDFAQQTFGVPVMRGPLEEQALSPGSFDILTMMDVLEHVAEPVVALSAAFEALADDGILVIQTPAAPPHMSWEAMVAADHPFLPLMRERGHLYLFRDTGVRRLLAQLGIHHVMFEPAYFSAYDMFVIASRRPLACLMPSAMAEALQVTPDSRLVLAMLDLDDRWNDLQARYSDAERDRAARLAALHEHGTRLMVAQGEIVNLRQRLAAMERARSTYVSVISERGARLAASEADRAARLGVIKEQGDRLSVLGHELAELHRHLTEIESDRAARLAVIQEQGERLSTLKHELAASEADRAARLAVIQEQGERLSALGHELAASEADRAARLAVIQEQGERLSVLEPELAELRRHLTEVMANRAAQLSAMQDRWQVLATENEGLRAELAALRFHEARALARRLIRRVRATIRAAAEKGDVGPVEDSLEVGPSEVPAPPRTAPHRPPARAVTVHQSLDDYVRTIEAFTRTRPDLVPVRGYNHAMVDALDDAVSIAGRTLLDIGASPHGFSLERALTQGITTYLGVGLGVWEPVEVRHQTAVGRLVAGDAEAIALERDSVDLAMSLSTFEHFADGAAVLREIYRVLRPAGRLFVNFQPVWTSSEGHHLHHLAAVTRLIPPWVHLLWTPTAMRRALKERWPADAPMSLDEAVAWVYESGEINRTDVVTLRRMFETSPFTIEWMTPLPDDCQRDKPQLAAYLSTFLPYSAEDLLTRGFSIMMQKK
jgi:2-polyprenyl-3-methyl-5-hydroxy-6-metoxy-1,4-benzoquinol methylase